MATCKKLCESRNNQLILLSITTGARFVFIYPAYLYFKFWKTDNFDNRFALKCAYIWVVIAQLIGIAALITFRIIDPNCTRFEESKGGDIDYFYVLLPYKLFYTMVYLYTTVLVCRLANVQLVDFDSEE